MENKELEMKLAELWDAISEAGGGSVWQNLTREQWTLSRDLFELKLDDKTNPMSQKESEWGEQLKRLQMALYVSVPSDVAEDACKRINTIIESAISTREKEIAEEIKKIKTAGHDECNDDFLMNVLKILNHK